jgi:hypothetical protein
MSGDYEIRNDRGSRAASTAVGVVLVLAAIMGALLWASCVTGCASAAPPSYDCAGSYVAAGRAYDAGDIELGDKITAEADAHCPGAR